MKSDQRIKLGIVTINYLNWKDTIEMVNSLKEQTFQAFRLVIIDNHSDNLSFEKLSESFSNDPQIFLLHTRSNLGFAKANNLGIKFLKEKFSIDKVFIINNDLIFRDPDYLANLMKITYGSDVGAIGTNILAGDDFQQNPVYENTSLLYLLEQNWDFLFCPIFHWRHNLFRKISQWTGRPRPEKGDFKKQKIFILHGSAILLTENYLKRSVGFYPKTFLYFEENILKIIFDKLGLKMLYLPIDGIYHKEDRSSKLAKQDDSFKIKLLTKNSLKAIWLKILPPYIVKKMISD
ncbi:glycosyltransferase [Oenococcus alcoholitolerans]|uniref:glycosyltransferase n=1 Tax=Oenococcus alcoholitolerans TaxID=931074 RepID=UPI003F70EA6C